MCLSAHKLLQIYVDIDICYMGRYIFEFIVVRKAARICVEECMYECMCVHIYGHYAVCFPPPGPNGDI